MEESKKPQGGFWKRLPRMKVLLIIMGVIVVFGLGSGVYLVKASNNPDFCVTCHIMQPY